MIRKRSAIGMLFTPSQNFMITGWGFNKIGMENETEVDTSEEEDSDPLYYYPRPGVLEIKGSYVYKEFPQPQEIYIYVDEEEHEK
jgi:hypothetical protein